MNENGIQMFSQFLKESFPLLLNSIIVLGIGTIVLFAIWKIAKEVF